MTTPEEIQDEIHNLRKAGYEPDKIHLGEERLDELRGDNLFMMEEGKSGHTFGGIDVVAAPNARGVIVVDESTVRERIVGGIINER